jgi:hypothetical protein
LHFVHSKVRVDIDQNQAYGDLRCFGTISGTLMLADPILETSIWACSRADVDGFVSCTVRPSNQCKVDPGVAALNPLQTLKLIKSRW